MKKTRILVLNGPSLSLLGVREPDIYGRADYRALCRTLRAFARKNDLHLSIRQTNHEGRLVDWILSARRRFDGILINPAAYTHTSVALLDALRAVALPAVEVHLSDTSAREEYRRVSFVREACLATVQGKGFAGYEEALGILAAACRERDR